MVDVFLCRPFKYLYLKMLKFKLVRAILKGDVMKISKILSKNVLDDAISKSENIEGLCTVLITVVVASVVSHIFNQNKVVKEKY